MGAMKQLQIAVLEIEGIIADAKKELGDDLGGMSVVDLIADNRPDLSLREIRELIHYSQEGFGNERTPLQKMQGIHTELVTLQPRLMEPYATNLQTCIKWCEDLVEYLTRLENEDSDND